VRLRACVSDVALYFLLGKRIDPKFRSLEQVRSIPPLASARPRPYRRAHEALSLECSSEPSTKPWLHKRAEVGTSLTRRLTASKYVISLQATGRAELIGRSAAPRLGRVVAAIVNFHCVAQVDAVIAKLNPEARWATPGHTLGGGRVVAAGDVAVKLTAEEVRQKRLEALAKRADSTRNENPAT
jgi:hypothetical protein